MKKLFGVAQLEEARSCASSIKKHNELKSCGRFWYQEIRDFLNSKHTVSSALRTRSVGDPNSVGARPTPMKKIVKPRAVGPISVICILFLFVFFLERKSAQLIRGSVEERRGSLLLLLRSRQGKRDKLRNEIE